METSNNLRNDIVLIDDKTRLQSDSKVSDRASKIGRCGEPKSLRPEGI